MPSESKKGGTFFTEDLQQAQEDALTSACSIFGFYPLHIFHMGISKLFEEFILTYLGAEAKRSHPGRLVSEKRPLGSMQMFISRALASIRAEMERDYSLPELGIYYLHKESLMHQNRSVLNGEVEGMMERKN